MPPGYLVCHSCHHVRIEFDTDNFCRRDSAIWPYFRANYADGSVDLYLVIEKLYPTPHPERQGTSMVL